MKKGILAIACFLLLLAGSVLILYPTVQEKKASQNQEKIVTEIQKKRVEKKEEGEERYDLLYRDMQEYNREIYENRQKDLKDAWSYQQPVFTLEEYGVVDEAVGYLTIEAMDLCIPLYLGAVEENLSRGAAVLGQTSMPVGGMDSNCVIAAHRGWKGIPMFVEIENLKPGDPVVLDNLWETLNYEVKEIRVIRPDETDAVKIQPGRDLLTLITCHPYRNNYQRYVVYCERKGSSQTEEKVEETDGEQEVQIRYSQEEIRQEQQLNQIGILILAAAWLLFFLFLVKACLRSRRKRS